VGAVTKVEEYLAELRIGKVLDCEVNLGECEERLSVVQRKRNLVRYIGDALFAQYGLLLTRVLALFDGLFH